MRDSFKTTVRKTIISAAFLCLTASGVAGQEANENQSSLHRKQAEASWKQLREKYPDEFSALKVFMSQHSRDSQYLPEVERLFMNHLTAKSSELKSRLVLAELKVDSVGSSTAVTASQSASGAMKFKEGSTISRLTDGRENLLGHGAIHRWAGSVAVQLPGRTGVVKTYRFVGDEDDPLTFGLIRDVGWVHLHGTGKVILPDGRELAAMQTSGPAAAAEESNEQPTVRSAPQSSDVVATIGDYSITREELAKRLMTGLYPYDYENYSEEAEPADAQTMLMTMVAEKAMVIEARKQGHLEDEATQELITRLSERRLVDLLLQKHLLGKIIVTPDEIEQKMKADPKLDQARAKAALERARANSILDQYYKQIHQKSHVKKLSENFLKATQIHQRLLYRPKKPRNMAFIRTDQIREELTPQEKSIVLAEFDRGKVTLKDWLDTLCEIVPTGRPRDLNTSEGVDKLLDKALRMPLLVSEAKAIGLDRDPDLLKQNRESEDGRLLSSVKLAKHQEVKEPTTEQIIAYFNRHKETFGVSDSLKIDLIWCEDLKTAERVKAELDRGKDFDLAKQQYSLEKTVKPFDTRPSSEGLFWKDLWPGNPNQAVGPVKGFFRGGIKWRIVKILEKKPGQVKPYTNDMANQVKSRMTTELKKAIVAKYGERLLKKYPYRIYADRIKDIDPLNIP